MLVPIHASVTLAICVGQATSDDVTVSLIYFLFNLVTFLIIQLGFQTVSCLTYFSLF